jgi:starch synthase
MNILFAASEAAPFAKTGGLADVLGSLPAALAELGHDVRVIIPRYRCVDLNTFQLKQVATLQVPLGAWKERCDIYVSAITKNVTAYFVDKPIFFDRSELYGTAKADYPDNAERFFFFSRALLELCEAVDFRPDILHCNDWQTGLVPILLKTFYANTPHLGATRTIFTVHNLGYQGLFPADELRLTNLGWNVFTPNGIEFWGKINCLKAGLVYADSITTVSKTYSREIQTPEHGHGLNGVLKKRTKDLTGIVNGIDFLTYDPMRDQALPKPFSATKPEGRSASKAGLRKTVGLPASRAPIVGMVTRLADQKGLDILCEALPEIMELGADLIILGTGDQKYHTLLADAALRYPDRMRVLLQYNDALARNIYAGCDMLLMPSLYEPCGLSQMIAFRYGAVPVVRKTGGLKDTVTDYQPKTGLGTGFLFTEYSAEALVVALRRALEAYAAKTKWKRLMQRGMKQDFSWEHSAREYVKLYRKTMRKK